MSKKSSKKVTYLWRWALFTTILGIVILVVIDLFTKNIGYTSDLSFWGKSIYNLPFPISRWWDILCGPILTTICILYYALGDLAGPGEPVFKDYLIFFAGFGFIVGYAVGAVYNGIASALFSGITTYFLTIVGIVIFRYIYILVDMLYHWLFQA